MNRDVEGPDRRAGQPVQFLVEERAISCSCIRRRASTRQLFLTGQRTVGAGPAPSFPISERLRTLTPDWSAQIKTGRADCRGSTPSARHCRRRRHTARTVSHPAYMKVSRTPGNSRTVEIQATADSYRPSSTWIRRSSESVSHGAPAALILPGRLVRAGDAWSPIPDSVTVGQTVGFHVGPCAAANRWCVFCIDRSRDRAGHRQRVASHDFPLALCHRDGNHSIDSRRARHTGGRSDRDAVLIRPVRFWRR